MRSRNFSDFEKDVIRRMLEIDSNKGFLVLNNLLARGGGNSLLPYDCYLDLKSENEVTIQVRQGNLKNSSQKVFKDIDWKVSKIIISLTDLFRHLEDARMILLYGDYNAKAIGNKWRDEPYQTCNFIDNELMPKIYQLARRKVFVSESLRKLVEDDFMTQEEMRHKAEIKLSRTSILISWIATGVAIFGLIASLFIPFFKSDSVTIANQSLNGVVEIPELKRIQTIEKNYQKNQAELEATLGDVESSVAKLSASNKDEFLKLRKDISEALDAIRNSLKNLNIEHGAESENGTGRGTEK